jgi:hypothetical protein
MNKNFLYLIFLFLTFLTFCSGLKLDIKGQEEKVKKWESIALLEVLICPPETPVFPIVDVSFYKDKFKNIYDEINFFHDKNADTIVKYLGHLLEKYSKSKIIYGENLFTLLSTDSLKKYKIKTYPLILNNEYFPKISLPNYFLNFFDFLGESSPAYYFEYANLDIIKPQIKKICKLLKVNGILIVIFSINTVLVGSWGNDGNRLLYCEFLFFDKEGEKICSGEIESEQTWGRPDDMLNYKFVFCEYYLITDLFLRKLYLGEYIK